MKEGLLFVLSGPSGCGKGTVLKEALGRRKLFLSVSATSRQKREGEVEGVNYFFLTREQFVKKVAENQLLEYTETYGNFYGTPKQPILDALALGDDIILEIDTVGALTVKNNYPDAILIFLAPPTLDELKQRLINRGTETAKQIETRVSCYAKEMSSAGFYDYIVVNDDVKEATNEILTIIDAEHLKVKNNLKFISKFIGGTEQ